MIDNPWLVESIQDFYFLKCPECSFDTQQEFIFQKHSIENHPLSYVFFQTKIEDAADPFEGFKIKQEPAELVETSYDIKQETTNDNYDYYDYVERDIKNEFVDANEQPSSYDHNIKPKKRQRKQKIEERIGFGEEIEEQIPTGIKSDTIESEFVDNEEPFNVDHELLYPYVESAVYEEKKPIVEINYRIVQIKQDEKIPHCSKCDRKGLIILPTAGGVLADIWVPNEIDS